MKIVFFEVSKENKEYLKKKITKHKIYFFEEELDEDSLEKYSKIIKDANIISVFIYSKINKKILDKCDKLKAICTRSTGFDHIDINECRKQKIKVFNTPFYGENTVAEHAFALILALSRKLYASIDGTKNGDFSTEKLQGFDLKGKTIGIVGLGHIGEHIARIANGFEMNVLVSTPRKDKNLEKKYSLKFVSFNYLLKNSDIITFHCPYNKQTHHLINSKNINQIKKGAYIINTARGGLIQTKALTKAIQKGIISGAALDVLEEEDLIKEEVEMTSKKFSRKELEMVVQNHTLMKFDNVIITPHNAFNSREAVIRILDTTIKNINCSSSNKKKCYNEVFG